MERARVKKLGRRSLNSTVFIALAGVGTTLALANEVATLNGSHAKNQRVHLTFDDGPHPTLTPELLDILKQNHVKATFFMIGQNVRRFPDIVRRVEAEGHAIGNHSDTHPHLTQLDVPGIEGEVDRCESSLEAALGHKVGLFRPPYGDHNAIVRGVLFDRGFDLDVTWNVDSEDWKSLDRRVIVPKVINDVTAAGHGIVLMHDIHPETIASVQGVIDGLRGAGFTLVDTLADLTGDPAPAPAASPAAPATPDPTASPAPAAPSSPAPSVNLRRGSTGPRVEALQQALVDRGASLSVDGDFGPATEAAVVSFQGAHGLVADGIAGPKTLAALGLPLD